MGAKGLFWQTDAENAFTDRGENVRQWLEKMVRPMII